MYTYVYYLYMCIYICMQISVYAHTAILKIQINMGRIDFLASSILLGMITLIT